MVDSIILLTSLLTASVPDWFYFFETDRFAKRVRDMNEKLLMLASGLAMLARPRQAELIISFGGLRNVFTDSLGKRPPIMKMLNIGGQAKKTYNETFKPITKFRPGALIPDPAVL